MKFSAADEVYLLGNKISAGRQFYVEHQSLKKRDEFIFNFCSSKKVLHIGCVDHVDLIDLKIRQKKYLHLNLDAISLVLHGFDTNISGIKKMRELGICNLFTSIDQLIDFNYDVVIVPDVIEHVVDVGSFLESIKKIKSKKFIFTTPNALCYDNRIRFNHELVNTDHNKWFSPYTISKLLSSQGFNVDSVSYADSCSIRNVFKYLAVSMFPVLRDTIVVEASFKL